MAKKQSKHQEKTYSERTLKTAKELRVIDDTLFRLVASRPEVCEEILQTLLGNKKLKVLRVNTQETVKSLQREIILDCLCDLGEGNIINIEVQKGNYNNDVKRCRFHLSSITANYTPKGTDFDDVPDVTVIYITEYDALNNKQTITYSKMCRYDNLTEAFVPVEDGGLIVYANTCINDGTDKSELLELFLRKDSFDNKKFPNLSDAIQYFKDDEKGVSEVCAVVEAYAKNEIVYAVIESYIDCDLDKDTIIEKIRTRFNLTKEEAEAYYDDISVKI